MAFPIEGMKVFIEADGLLVEYLDPNGNIQTVKNKVVAVSNYEYEINLNEAKRTILALRPEYLGTVITDLRNIMKYNRSSQFINSRTKRAFNPRIPS
jgi:hypothetical protein